MTSTFWRNAWRYRERAYRHTFWDAGTSLSHILAVAASARVAATLVFGFADPLVNALLDVEGTRESTVALVALGRTDDRAAARAAGRAARPAHAAAVVRGGDLPRAHRHAPRLLPADRRGRRAVAVAPMASRRTPNRPARSPSCGRCPTDELDARPPEQIIFRRRSTRKYDTEVEIPFAAFSTLLDRSTRGVASDVLVPGAPLTDLYLIVNGVEGLAPGRLPAPPAARRGRAPPRGHLPRRGPPHRGRPAATRATRT